MDHLTSLGSRFGAARSSLAFKSRRALLGALGILVFSCLPQSQPVAPKVSPGAQLGLAPTDTGQAAPFALVHAAPQGKTVGDPAIQLVFSRPLRALGIDVPVPNHIALTPAVPGHWEWVGVHGLTFVPDAGYLPRASAFEVVVPAALRAQDGTTLGKESRLRFETPRPVVSQAWPNDQWSEHVPRDVIELTFSQPVRVADITDYLSVSAGETSVPVEVSAGKTPYSLLIKSKQGWPLASTINYAVRPGYHSTEGTLGADQAFQGAFKTYGPLTAQIECDRKADGTCRPEGGLRLELSNPVPARKLAQAIRAEGASLHVDQDWANDTTTRHLMLETNLVPRSKFNVVIDQVVDIYGQPLKWVKDRSVVVGDRRPRVSVGFDGELFGETHGQFQVGAVNASYELVLAPLSASELMELYAEPSTAVYARLVQLPQAKKRRVAVGALNERTLENVRLDEVTQRGPFALGISYQSEGRAQYITRIAQRTNLAATVKQGRAQSHAWVTDNRTGAPVAGAELSVLGSSARTRSNQDGLAELPSGLFVASAEKELPRNWLHITTASDALVRPSDQTIGSWRIAVDCDFWNDEHDLAFLFPERDLFRPGEKAWIKAYVRRPQTSGNRPLVEQALTLTLQSPSGEIVEQKQLTTNAFGAASTQITIPGSAALGYFSVLLHRAPSPEQSEPLASTSLQVAEFRPAEFEVKVNTAQPAVLANQEAHYQVTGSYLYGGLMKDARLEYSIARRPSSFRPPGSDDYDTSDETWQYHEPYRSYDPLLKTDEAKLDAFGRWDIKWPARFEHQVGPEVLDLEATVYDLSGQTISGRSGVLVHAADHYIGIHHPESYLVDAPGVVRPGIRAFSPAGVPVAGRRVDVQLYRLRWTQARQAGSNGSSETVSEVVRDLVSSCSVTTATLDQSCELSVKDGGEHIIRASSTDAAGRRTYASSSIYALGGGRAAAFRDEDERARVELTPDRKLYVPGQTARILIKSPFERARAWVTIERENVVQQRLITVEGATPTLSVPITDAMRPNVFVGVHLLEDRKTLGKKAHAVAQSYRLGYAELRIDPERQRLQVTAQSDRSDYRPGDEVKLNFKVQDQQARLRKAEIAVFVVDEGVLSLSGFQLPDPLLPFTASRPLRVETHEARETMARLIGLEANESENKGDAGGDGGEARSDMLTTAYFNPSILTDARGQAQVTFKLPDNLGRFRIMALAVTDDDRYGKGENSFNVNRPLMVRPALPRFIRAGDELELSAVVSGLGNSPGPVHVVVSTQGLELLGSAQADFDLPKDASHLVSFRARAKAPGSAQIQFRAASGQASDAVTLSRRVQSPATLETVALYGKTQKAEAFALGALDEARPDMGGLDVTLSSSALVGLKGGFEQLWDYPYLCSEQLASRILPLVMLRELAGLYGVALPADADQRVEYNVAQLLRRQQGDGGFAFWPELHGSDPWVSAYALWVLHEAQRKGFSVLPSVLERGTRYLRDVSNQRDQAHLATATFATFVLSRLGKPDVHTINALLPLLAQMDVESQFLLAWAAASTDAAGIKKQLLDRVQGAITPRGNRAEVTAPAGDAWAARFGSSTRLHAIALSALLSLAPDHPLAAPLVRSLLEARDGGHWENTQESAFALLALHDYQQAQEREEPQFDALVFMRDQLLGKKRFVGRSTQAQEFSVAMHKLVAGAPLIFEQKGSGTLFFEGRLKYARTELPKTALESGFLIKKHIVPYAPGANAGLGSSDAVSSVKHGDLLIVELTVLNPTRRRFVVIDDPLPAGFEGIDLSQATAQGTLATLLGGAQADSNQVWHRQELRDDRVLYFVDDLPPGIHIYRYLARATTRGRFIVPPSVAKEMYHEEVYGRTAAQELTVQ